MGDSIKWGGIIIFVKRCVCMLAIFKISLREYLLSKYDNISDIIIEVYCGDDSIGTYHVEILLIGSYCGIVRRAIYFDIYFVSRMIDLDAMLAISFTNSLSD